VSSWQEVFGNALLPSPFLRRTSIYGTSSRSMLPPRHDHVLMSCNHRWAAKEAVIKAVRYRRLTFWDVQIIGSRSSPGTGPVYALILDSKGSGHTPHGRGVRQWDVTAILQNDLNDVLHQHGAANLQRDGSAAETQDYDPDPDGQVAKVNISHDGDYATAVCLAVDLPRDGDVGGEAAAREP